MTSATFWDSVCPEHGGLSHAVFHEAGHGVLAVHFEYRFVAVSINADPRQFRNAHGGVTGGGVEMESVEIIADLVRTQPVEFLQFCLAGALAENEGFGHILKGSERGDINLWKNLAGMVEAQTEASLELALGRPFREVAQGARQLVRTNGTRISALARALGESPQMSLTYDDVLGVLADIE